ncbi:MAG: ABC transporter permease [bacterium]|nr:ABC transporter permease [bacterium]MCP4798371.1 ABC transporter permease [bacterium]
MSNALTIFRREFSAYFNSPIAYIFIIVFLILNCGLFMTPFFLQGNADMRDFFGNLPLFLIFFIPAVSMRLWAEDKSNGTFELLMTLPMKSSEVMFGKYFAAMAFYCIALLGTLPIPLMLMMLGNPDLGAIFGGYIGAILLGGLYMSVGIFTSGLLKDQITAFILGMLACFALFLIGIPAVSATIDGWFSGFGSFLQNAFGLMPHYQSLQRGVLDISDLLYFVTLTGAFLVMNTYWLEGRKY